MKLAPTIFGSGKTLTSLLNLRQYAPRQVIGCAFSNQGDMNWDPTMQLESVDALLWLRFWETDYSVSTGGARQFTASNKTTMSRADNAMLSMGDVDIYRSFFFYPSSTNADYPYLMMKVRPIIGGEYEVYFAKTARYVAFVARKADNSGYVEAVSANNSITLDAWNYVELWHDSVANEIGIRVNRGTAVTTAIPAGVRDSVGLFEIGGYASGGAWSTTRISRMHFLKNTAARAVIDSAATRTEMYNLGRGILSGNLDLLLADLGTFTAGVDWDSWNLNETDGTADARSFSGLNDLTPTFGELITNGGFETAGGGGADVFGSWEESIVGTGAIADEGSIVDAGSHAAKITSVDGSNWASINQQVTTSGHRYAYSFRARNGGSGNARFYVGGFSAITLTSSYQTFSGTGTAIDVYFQLDNNGSNGIAYFDAVSVTAVDIPSVDGPSSDIAPDTGSVGTAHGQLIGFADSETARSTDVPTAIGSGTSLAFDGVDDYVSCGSIGAVTAISMYVKQLVDDQQILTLANSTATAVTVAAGVLTFGASLTASSITVDGVSMSAADAGAALNDNAWHLLAFSLTSISATDLRLGTDSSSYGQVMLDDVKFNAGALAYYTFDEETSLSISDGDPIAVARSLEGNRYQFLNATASERADYVASAINGKPGLEFDGVDDLLEYVGACLTGTVGTTIAIYKVKAVPDAYQVVIASSDTATTNKRMVLYARGNTANPHLGYSQQNADTEDLLDGNTSVTDELDCASYWASNGTTVTARLNGTAQTLNADSGANNGDWWDDATGKDNVTIGALKHTSETQHAAIILCELIAYPINLSDASRATVAAYVLREYGLTL